MAGPGPAGDLGVRKTGATVIGGLDVDRSSDLMDCWEGK